MEKVQKSVSNFKPSEIKRWFLKSIKYRTVISIDYTNVEWLIDEVFKNENHIEGYNLPDLEERGSGHGWEISVKKEKIEGYYLIVLEQVKSGKWPPFYTKVLLNECCNRGLIPEGNYLIDINW